MRPVASTAVASMQKIEAPDSASELMWVKCQSLASPLTDEYWHIGATMMRLASVRPRSLIGVNKALMGGDPDRRESDLQHLASRSERPPPPGFQPSPIGLMPAALISSKFAAVSRFTSSSISAGFIG